MTCEKRFVLPVASLFVFLAIFGLASAQTGREAEGRAAEQAGRLREALTHYVAALQSVSEGSADDQRLRETIIKLVQKLTPAPAVPEEARRFSVRGRTWINEGKNPSDFDEAAKEFAKAVRLAPWWADGYINQAVALEKAGKFSEAIRSLKLYLLAAPTAPDAEKVREQIYALEVRQERAQKEAVTRDENQARKRREEEARRNDPARISGEWCLLTREGIRVCAWTIRVSGDVAEIWTRYTDDAGSNHRAVFRGRVDGDRITGSFIIMYGRACGWQEFPMEASIDPNASRINISHQVSRRSGGRGGCEIFETATSHMVLVKR